MRRAQLAPLVCLAVAAGLFFWSVYSGGGASAAAPVQPVKTSGQETPRAGCLLENGWNVCAYGDADLRDVFLRFQDVLAEPVSGFDSRSQVFRFGALTFNPGNTDGWKVEFANLGYQDMVAQGLTPRPGSELHPAVRDWLISQMEMGLDTTRVVGRILSDPRCDPKTGACRQWTDKQLFLFSQEAVTGDQVQRAPLGLWSVRPPAAEPQASGHGPAILPLALGVLLGLIGLALLVTGGNGRRATITT